MFIEGTDSTGSNPILINTACIERIDYVPAQDPAHLYLISGTEVLLPNPDGFDALLEMFNERLKTTT